MQQPTQPALVVSRSLMAILFLVAGVRKLLAYGGTLGYLTQLGVPLPEVALPVIILIEIGGGIALVLGWQTQWIASLLAGFTLVTAFLGHRFWAVDPAQFSGQLNHFLKNVAITGAFIGLASAARARLLAARQ